MKYNEIKDADDLSGFLMEGLSDNTVFLIYKALRSQGDDRIHESSCEATDPIQVAHMIVAEHFYCAGYNLTDHLTAGTHMAVGTAHDEPLPTQPPRSKNPPKVKYEFFYNWDYCIHNNPSLMGFGTTGGYGATRATMIEAVSRADWKHAEQCFWVLIKQTIQETWNEYHDEEQYNGMDDQEIMESLMTDWFGYLMDNVNGSEVEHHQEERNFVRVQSPYQGIQREYEAPGS